MGEAASVLVLASPTPISFGTRNWEHRIVIELSPGLKTQKQPVIGYRYVGFARVFREAAPGEVRSGAGQSVQNEVPRQRVHSDRKTMAI